MIPPGMRAVPVRVNEVVGVAGFVVPGMRVDVLISGQQAERRQRPRARSPGRCCKISRCSPRARISRRIPKASRCRCR